MLVNRSDKLNHFVNYYQFKFRKFIAMCPVHRNVP